MKHHCSSIIETLSYNLDANSFRWEKQVLFSFECKTCTFMRPNLFYYLWHIVNGSYVNISSFIIQRLINRAFCLGAGVLFRLGIRVYHVYNMRHFSHRFLFIRMPTFHHFVLSPRRNCCNVIIPVYEVSRSTAFENCFTILHP